MKIIKDIKRKKEYDKRFVIEGKGENVILAKNVFLGVDDSVTGKNLNTLVVGQAGSCMNERFVKPNLLQGNTSFIVTDPCGDMLRSTGTFLESIGYKIKVLNLINMANSNHYNPFHYVCQEEDILLMVDCLLQNTSTNIHDKNEFYEKCEQLLLETICFFIFEAMSKESQNLVEITELLRQMGSSDKDGVLVFEKIFELYKKDNPDSPAVKRYDVLIRNDKKFLIDIFISCSIRLAALNLALVANLTSSDEFEFEKMGEEKTAIFCVVPNTNFVLPGLVSLFYIQAFDALYRCCNKNEDYSRFSIPVRFFYDVNSGFGAIPELESMVVAAKPYNIYFSLLVQNFSEMRELYPEWEIIKENCDSVVLFGSQDNSAVGYFDGEVRSKNIIFASKRFDLFSLDDEHCICLIRGYDSFYSKKYKYEKHPNFRYTSDAYLEFVYDFSRKENIDD